ncbi:pyruvate dehydrogenase complex dihydrolipoamide acetyltransferase [Pseudoblastomonas halimionae]|uniref:Acetyltransferase component of pyruvate dehydrogenase complex n=1 Tax=Alteriqipengyuania halimionae TaxID=1926630 RepID=A0A6I4U0S0_9SPHN|nr:pyruvate dehydrogenase complex dihydrolipoamide acetyltransferase [Alteriqipengyuania halimionae]MXP09478.1 pyruvate dehydrogenase complex dihydrolipoamide acetyltransferase [Alteriqipengyuania halimionae]
MPIAIKMPALSPTMEEGTLAKWLVKVGDTVAAGDIMAEIETDKATMEFEAVDEGTVADIAVEEGSEGVAVGTVIMTLAEEGEDLDEAKAAAGDGGDAPAPPPAPEENESSAPEQSKTSEDGSQTKDDPASAGTQDTAKAPAAPTVDGERIIASPLARRIAEQNGLELSSIEGSGPNGRIVKADVEGATGGQADKPAAKRDATEEMAPPRTPSKTPAESEYGAPYEEEKLSNVRKVIARRLTESKQQVPHYYLSVDIRLDAMLDLRKQLNAGLEADGVKLSVNDLLIKALARALMRVPQCNVSFQGDTLHRYSRADVSVAVAAPTGLITPIITEADTKGLAAISTQMKALAEKARDGKLQPHEYQGGTASLSNLGMFGIKQFDAVINPPQGMIMAVGAGEQRPYVVDGALQVATVMTASGSFDHRAIDGADGAQLMEAFKQLCENPMGLVV